MISHRLRAQLANAVDDPAFPADGTVEETVNIIPEARSVLARARDLMHERRELLAQTDLNPRRDLPRLVIVVDEAQQILGDAECHDLVEELLAMSRKCGITIRLDNTTPEQGQP